VKIGKRRFLRHGHKIFILDGVNTIRYFDLKRFRLVKYDKDWLKK